MKRSYARLNGYNLAGVDRRAIKSAPFSPLYHTSRLCFLLASLLCALTLTACGVSTTSPPPILLKVAGSTSMQPLLTRLAAAYSAQQPHVTFDIQGGDSQLGQTLVESQQVDIGLDSGPPVNLSEQIHRTPIARDAIAIVLNRQNSGIELSLREWREVFNGHFLNWQEVDGPPLPIQVVSREDGSGTRMVFEAAVMEDKTVTSTAIVLPSSQAVIDFVAQNPTAVGYVSFGFVDERVYTAPVDGVSPNLDNLAAGSYFLTRDLALLTPTQARPEVKQFIEFALSPAGQALIGEKWGKVR